MAKCGGARSNLVPTLVGPGLRCQLGSVITASNDSKPTNKPCKDLKVKFEKPQHINFAFLLTMCTLNYGREGAVD